MKLYRSKKKKSPESDRVQLRDRLTDQRNSVYYHYFCFIIYGEMQWLFLQRQRESRPFFKNITLI